MADREKSVHGIFRKQSLFAGLMILSVVALLWPLGWLHNLAFPPDIETSKDSVRLRNAIIASVGRSVDFSWNSDAPPVGFLLNGRDVPAEFVQASQGIHQGHQATTNFAKGLEIARHLGSRRGDGTPILSSTYITYQRITADGDGYCSDYSQVFNALAIAANIPVREWGLSFDGFGGDGHAFNEVYDYEHRKWIMIDSYWSFYPRDAITKAPLSALEFKKLLVDNELRDRLEVVRISPERFAFKSDEALLAFYRRGANQLFLYWGNNVFDYDAHPLVLAMSKISRAAEQASAILIGVHPEIRILPDSSNGEEIAKLQQMRDRFVLTSLLVMGLLMALAIEAFFFFRARRYSGVASE